MPFIAKTLRLWIKRADEHPGTGPIAFLAAIGWVAADFAWWGPALMFAVFGSHWFWYVLTGKDLFEPERAGRATRPQAPQAPPLPLLAPGRRR